MIWLGHFILRLVFFHHTMTNIIGRFVGIFSLRTRRELAEMSKEYHRVYNRWVIYAHWVVLGVAVYAGHIVYSGVRYQLIPWVIEAWSKIPTVQ